MSYSESCDTSGDIFISRPSGWPMPPAAPRTATLRAATDIVGAAGGGVRQRGE